MAVSCSTNNVDIGSLAAVCLFRGTFLLLAAAASDKIYV